jgi:membrane protein YqaA with SNARE-associated domain
VFWQEVLVGLTSAGFGVLSAVVPAANAEAYVLAARASGWGAASVVGIALGQTTGKLGLFLAARRGRQWSFWRRRGSADRAPRPPGRLARLSARLLALLGTKRWGLPVVLLAALVGIPPMYAVAILAGTTTMNPVWFVAVVGVGRLARFSLLALGVAEVLLHWR